MRARRSTGPRPGRSTLRRPSWPIRSQDRRDRLDPPKRAELCLAWQGQLYESAPGPSPDIFAEATDSARHGWEPHGASQHRTMRLNIARYLAIPIIRGTDRPVCRMAHSAIRPPQESNPRPGSGTELGRSSPDRPRTLQYFPKLGPTGRTFAPRITTAQLEKNKSPSSAGANSRSIECPRQDSNLRPSD